MRKYKCDEFPGPVVSGSWVNWVDQMTSAFFSFWKFHRSEYFGSSENCAELMTAWASVAALAMSPGAARVRYTSASRCCAAGFVARP